jgi:hypothetical protein
MGRLDRYDAWPIMDRQMRDLKKVLRGHSVTEFKGSVHPEIMRGQRRVDMDYEFSVTADQQAFFDFLTSGEMAHQEIFKRSSMSGRGLILEEPDSSMVPKQTIEVILANIALFIQTEGTYTGIRRVDIFGPPGNTMFPVVLVATATETAHWLPPYASDPPPGDPQ